MNIADQPIIDRTTDQPTQPAEPTFDLEQTILDLVTVVGSFGRQLKLDEQSIAIVGAAWDRLLELAKQLGSHHD